MKRVNSEFFLHGKKFLEKHEDLESVPTILTWIFANTAIYASSVGTCSYMSLACSHSSTSLSWLQAEGLGQSTNTHSIRKFSSSEFKHSFSS